MKTVLLTGASSYVGARIYADIKDAYRVIGTYFHHRLFPQFVRLDLTKKEAVEKAFRSVKPDVVVHVANYPSGKHARNNEEAFIALNGNATGHIAQSANDSGAKVIFISSQAANNPDDLYGKLKRESEDRVRRVRAGYIILRPSLIVGFSPNTTSDRPFNRILRCLDDGVKAGEFDTSWKLQPTYLGHISGVIDKAIQNAVWNNVIPIFIDKLVTQYQIARDILGRFGVSVRPVDLHFHIPPSSDDVTRFKKFDLPPHSYDEMIETIVGEIKNRKMFALLG